MECLLPVIAFAILAFVYLYESVQHMKTHSKVDYWRSRADMAERRVDAIRRFNNGG